MCTHAHTHPNQISQMKGDVSRHYCIIVDVNDAECTSHKKSVRLLVCCLGVDMLDEKPSRFSNANSDILCKTWHRRRGYRLSSFWQSTSLHHVNISALRSQGLLKTLAATIIMDHHHRLTTTA